MLGGVFQHQELPIHNLIQAKRSMCEQQ